MSFLEKLKKGVGIEKEFEEKLKSGPNFSVQNSEKPVPPNFVAKSLEESDQTKEKSKEKKRLKVKEKFTKSKPEIQEAIEEGKIKKEKWFESEGQLVIDVYQTEKELVILSAIAGLKPEDINISTQGDVVIIRGKREKPVKDKERNYFYQECYWGPFSREIILPVEADVSRAEASMTEGILVIRIPKIEREKEKKIIVKE